jgi:hypothetical protein
MFGYGAPNFFGGGMAPWASMQQFGMMPRPQFNFGMGQGFRDGSTAMSRPNAGLQSASPGVSDALAKSMNVDWNQYADIRNEAAKDTYAPYGSQWSGAMRSSVAANNIGQDTRGNVYTPGRLMGIARQIQAGAQAPKGLEWLSGAPTMQGNGDPRMAGIQDWYKRASAMQGNPGAFA